VEQYKALKAQLKGKILPSSNDEDVEIMACCMAACEKPDVMCEQEFHTVHSHKDHMGMDP